MTRLLCRRVTIAAAISGLVATFAPVSSAQAAIASASGYVWAYDPSAPSYTVPILDSGPGWTVLYYAANDGGGPVTITRSAVGTYRVSFGGLGAVAPSGGVAHVAAYGTTSNLCTVVSWVPVGGDLRLSVRCFDSSGAPADTRFVANFVSMSGTSPGAPYSYLWADQPTTADYAPNWMYRFDAGGAAARVIRDRQGTYRAYLPSSAGETTTTFYQTTAYASTAVSCASVGYLGAGWVRVLCRDASGGLVDSRFSVTYATRQLLWRIAPTYHLHARGTAAGASVTWVSDSSTSHLVAVARHGVGDYEVFLPEIGTDTGHAVVYSSNLAGGRCAVRSWRSDGVDVWLKVWCTNHLGVSADSSFFAAFTW